MQAMAGTTDVKPSDIFSMTTTVIGGFTIGGVAVMQYRKYKWAEYQAKLDEDSKTGQRLSTAIVHLGEEQKLHIRLGAIYEFKNLAEDSPRNKENIVQILTAFLKSYQPEEGQSLPQDVEAAARVLSKLAREMIEDKAKKLNLFLKSDFILAWLEQEGFFKILMEILYPPQCVFDATEMISNLSMEDKFPWVGLKADKLILEDMMLRDADLRQSNFKGTSLKRSHLEGTDLYEAYLEGTNLQGISINSETNFVGAYIDEKTRFDESVQLKTFSGSMNIEEIIFPS